MMDVPTTLPELAEFYEHEAQVAEARRDEIHMDYVRQSEVARIYRKTAQRLREVAEFRAAREKEKEEGK